MSQQVYSVSVSILGSLHQGKSDLIISQGFFLKTKTHIGLSCNLLTDNGTKTTTHPHTYEHTVQHIAVKRQLDSFMQQPTDTHFK